ncbi:MAG: CoA transferase [Deltaproteobacteria bacterium]|nr:CoA transferase [Deltaproteobacteria bacterium]
MAMPLEGIRVLDWTQWQQGPVSTVILADMGADVIKIEHRERGDPGRGMKSIMGVMSKRDLPVNTYFESQNRNKRGITLDLGKVKGREVFHRLAKGADVLVHNFRKHVPAKLGVDYETLSALNPRLVYAVGSSFGPEGPEAGDTAMDLIAQARSGIMFTTGPLREGPRPVQGGLADQVGATHLALAVMGALLARERTGRGQMVEVSLLGSMIWFQQLHVQLSLSVDRTISAGDRKRQRNPLWNHYPCSDGRWIMLSMLQSDRYWTDFCRALGREDLAADPRFANMAARGENARVVIEELDTTFLTKPRSEWMQILREGGDFIFGPVNTYLDFLDDPQVLANRYIADFEHPTAGTVKIVNHPFHFSETPAAVRLPAPEFGQHTEEVLLEAGYSWEEIENLRRDEVI